MILVSDVSENVNDVLVMLVETLVMLVRTVSDVSDVSEFLVSFVYFLDQLTAARLTFSNCCSALLSVVQQLNLVISHFTWLHLYNNAIATK